MLFWFSTLLGVGAFGALTLPNFQPPWQSFFHEAVMAAAFIPVTLACLARRPALTSISWVMVFMAILVWIQHFSGLLIFEGDAWLATLYLLGGASVISAAASRAAIADTDSDLVHRSLWIGLLLAGLVSTAMAVHQWAGLDRFGLMIIDMQPKGRPYANLGQPNHLATLLMLAMVAAWLLWEQRVLSASTSAVVMMMLTFGVVLTLSRTPVAAMLWLIPLLAFASWKRWIRLKVRSIVVFAIFFAVLSIGLDDLNDLLYLVGSSSRFSQEAASFELRPEIWRDAINAIQRSPLLGYGWYQIPVAQTEVADGSQQLGQMLSSSHNLMLDMAVWFGLPVAVVLTIIFAGYFLPRFNAKAGVHGLASWFGIALILNHSMLEYPLFYAYFFLPLCWWMGGLSAISADVLRPKTMLPERWHAVSAVCVATVAVVLAVIVSWEYLRYQADWQINRFRVALQDRSIQIPQRVPLVLTNVDAMLEMEVYDPFAVPRQQRPERAVAVAERYPYPAYLFKLAVSQAIDGEVEEAGATLDKLCRVYRRTACEKARNEWETRGKADIPELLRVKLRPLP